MCYILFTLTLHVHTIVHTLYILFKLTHTLVHTAALLFVYYSSYTPLHFTIQNLHTYIKTLSMTKRSLYERDHKKVIPNLHSQP